MSGLDTQTHKHTHTHTHTQSDYRNPRCACAPRVNNDKHAPLHILFRSRNKDLIAAFLQYPSIELVIPGYRKRTPLHVIAETDNHEALELLHNSITITTVFKEKTSFRLCATDEDNLTPIHLASRVGSARALDFMMCKCMEYGYPPEVVLSFLDEENSTPLHAAVDGGHLSVVEVLLKQCSTDTRQGGATATHPPGLLAGEAGNGEGDGRTRRERANAAPRPVWSDAAAQERKWAQLHGCPLVSHRRSSRSQSHRQPGENPSHLCSICRGTSRRTRARQTRGRPSNQGSSGTQRTTCCHRPMTQGDSWVSPGTPSGSSAGGRL